jgi:hypothetical protein
MQKILAICLLTISVSLYGNAPTPFQSAKAKTQLGDAFSEDDDDDCCDTDDMGEVDEDIIIMDDEDTNDDEGVNN